MDSALWLYLQLNILLVPSSYRATEFPYWFGLILPFVIIYIFDWITFIIIMASLVKQAREHKVVQETKGQGTRKQIRRHLIIAVGLATVFGLGWGFGLAATSTSVEEVMFVFQLIFVIFVFSQSVLIFTLHGLRSEEAQNTWKSWFSTGSGETDPTSTVLVNLAPHDLLDCSVFTLPRDSTLGRDTTKKQVQSSNIYQESQFNEAGITVIINPDKTNVLT